MSTSRDDLMTFIGNFLVLPEAERDVLMQASRSRVLSKRGMLLDVGEVEREVWFVRNGYVRFFYINSAGDEVTSDFVFAPGFVTAFRSFIVQEPSAVGIQAMEQMELIGWNRDELYALYDRYPLIERVGRLMAEQVFLSLDKHLTAFLKQSPQLRYLWLLKEYPEFIRHIPLVYLASWLGITPETLSRIRRRTLR